MNDSRNDVRKRPRTGSLVAPVQGEVVCAQTTEPDEFLIIVLNRLIYVGTSEPPYFYLHAEDEAISTELYLNGAVVLEAGNFYRMGDGAGEVDCLWVMKGQGVIGFDTPEGQIVIHSVSPEGAGQKIKGEGSFSMKVHYENGESRNVSVHIQRIEFNTSPQ